MNKKRLLALVLAGAMSLSTATVAFAEEGKDIRELFDHTSLYEAVKAAAESKDGAIVDEILTWEEAQLVTELDISGKDIISLRGIECLHNLEELDASNNRIQDITFLSSLEELKEVDLSNNDIQDAAPVSAMKAIQTLDMSGNQIEETGPFNLATTLTELDLSNNLIKDAGGISQLTGLTKLNLAENDIEDTGAVQNLTALTELDLSGNEIRDLGGLFNLTAIKTLKLSDNRIEDVSPLSQMDKLTELDLDNNKVDADHLKNTLPENFQKNVNGGFDKWVADTTGTNDPDIDNTPKPEPTPDDKPSRRDDNDSDYYGVEKWDEVKRQIADADEGDTIKVSGTGLPYFPSSVARELKGKDITLEIRKNGVTYTVNGLEIGEIDKIWYEFENIEEQLLTAEPEEDKADEQKPQDGNTVKENPATGR